MAVIRTFVAVEFSDALKEEIGQIQQQLKKELGRLKWVPASNFHLTLKFLGDIESGRIQKMAEGLAAAVKGREAINLGFAGVGGFPKIQHPRVVWLGVDRGKQEMISLQKVVEAELMAQGFPAEKQAYSPHLTLARAFDDTDLKAVGEALNRVKVQLTRAEIIKSIRIMKSDLRPGGPVYTCLAEINF